jgi:hypothetical protein
MTPEEIKQTQSTEQLKIYAETLIRSYSKNVYEVRNLLMEQGLNKEDAERMARSAESEVEYETNEKAKREIGLGIGITLLGIFITYVSYTMAEAGESRRFILAWGMIVGGVVMLFRGVLRIS